ncbi:hypothetical protein ACLD43_08495 [Clostridium botulinum]|nr:BglG family transcriptional antiterminator [Clostridium botulinum]ACA53949.1 transcriptional antiterminator, BglG family [Clostridium botulinum A3 str. Loch Maree]
MVLERKSGEEIDVDKIEKIFVLKNRTDTKEYPEEVKCAKLIGEYAKKY